MEIELFTYDCIGCGKCMKHCPASVLELVDNGSCRFINVKNKDECTGCKKCEDICPVGAIRIEETNSNFAGPEFVGKRSGMIPHIIGLIVVLGLMTVVIMGMWNLIVPVIADWGRINY